MCSCTGYSNRKKQIIWLKLAFLKRRTDSDFYPLSMSQSIMSKIQRLVLHLCCIVVLLLKRKTEAVFYHIQGIARLFSQGK